MISKRCSAFIENAVCNVDWQGGQASELCIKKFTFDSNGEGGYENGLFNLMSAKGCAGIGIMGTL